MEPKRKYGYPKDFDWETQQREAWLAANVFSDSSLKRETGKHE